MTFGTLPLMTRMGAGTESRSENFTRLSSESGADWVAVESYRDWRKSSYIFWWSRSFPWRYSMIRPPPVALVELAEPDRAVSTRAETESRFLDNIPQLAHAELV